MPRPLHMSCALDNFRAARFRLRLTAVDRVLLSEHPGSAFRGGFGRVLRKVACPLGCVDTCRRPDSCAYAYLFETPAPAGSQVLEKIPTAPRPFVLQWPAERARSYEPGAAFEFGLVLVGRAIEYLPYFVYAFEELGRVGLGRSHGRYRLEEVLTVPAEGDPAPVFQACDRCFSDRLHRVSVAQLRPPPPDGRPLPVRFLSPTLLHYQGAAASPAVFHVFFRNLLRRVNFLNYFHCGGQLQNDARELIAAAEAVNTVECRLERDDWERYSARQDRRVPMGGFTGMIVWQGDLSQFWPWLVLGELVHVGSAATFGLGQYRIDV